jgi:hypothetical protein
MPTAVMWSSFYQTLNVTKEVAEINLGRDLVQQYFDNEKFQEIAKAINDCKVIYKGDGGAFTYQDINEFLGFFDELGLYHRRKALDYEIVDNFFGGMILEAFIYKEFEDYIGDLSIHSEEDHALENVLTLGSKLASDPRRSRQVAI